jgi:phenylacetate-CoA ligase
MGPSVSQDCQYHKGLHVWEDMFIVEVVDPVTGEPLPDGKSGELVFTTFTKEGFPLIRYRTRDISVLQSGKCECGRSHIRMLKPSGRTDDMLIIRGVNVFPSQIESVLLTVGDTSPHYQIIVDRVKGLETLEGEIRSKVESVLGVACGVRLVEPKSIARSEGKAKRVIDKRIKK